MDPSTVVTLLALNLLGIGGLFLLIGRHMVDPAGLRGFGIGSLAFGSGYLLRLALGFSSGGVAGVVADVCMVFATLAFATGLLQFSGGAAIGRRRVFTVTACYALVALAATALWQGVGRHATLNLGLAGAYGLLAMLAFRAARHEGAGLRLPLKLLAVLLVTIGLFTAVRGVAVMWVGLGPLFAGPAAQAYYACSVLFSTLLGPNLLWMVFVRLNGRLNEMATHDALTRLLNRNGLEEAMQRHFAARPPPRLALMLVDVDHFKRINDTHGHAAGDTVLHGVAQALKAQLRGADIVARWGGEEFMVCCHGAQPEATRALAERLRAAIEGLRHAVPGEPALACTVSIGVSLSFSDRAAWEPAARAADEALYAAKRCGRNQVRMAVAPRQDVLEPALS